MFRPIRTDTPNGKAAQALHCGQFSAFILAPGLAFEQVSAGGELWQKSVDGNPAAIPVAVVIPLVAFLCGLMLMYDGWWRLRHSS